MREFAPIPQDREHLVDAYVEALERANRVVNLVSRATVESIRSHHVAHSLTLAMRRFPVRSRIVDWGTGGGLPAIPLAIAFPEIEVIAVDSIAKKTRALDGIVREIGLENVTVWNGRAEYWDGRAHFAVSRATAPVDRLWSWTHRVLVPVESGEGEWEGGLLCLKGGDLETELRTLKKKGQDAEVERIALDETFDRSEWAGKYIVHVTPDREVRT